MIYRQNPKFWAALTLTLGALILCLGCGAAKSMSDPSEGAVRLAYSIPEGKSLRYSIDHNFRQNMEVRGRNVEIEMDENSIFSFDGMKESGDDYRLAVTIDTMGVEMRIPNQVIVPDVSGVIGKRFNMSLSSIGRESDIDGTESITYEIAPGESHSPVSGVMALFPDLPSSPVKIGDEWVSVDTVIETTSNSETRFIFTSTNILSGFQEIDGLDCAVIKARVNGTLSSEREQSGLRFSSSGTIEGEDTWFFDYTDGIFVKSVSKGSGEAITEAKAVGTTIIPATREYAITVTLLDN